MFRIPGLHRRDFMKLSAAGVLGTSMSGWLNVLATRAAQQTAQQGGSPRHKRCVLLWMDGGPSHKDTFDLKPGTENGGPYRPIATNVPGIQISEHLPQLAQRMNKGAIVRSMSTAEGAHGRAKYFLHTGYREGIGGLVYPSIGSIASMEIGDDTNPLPNYVVVGNRSYGSGFLGAAHQPLIVTNPQAGVANLQPYVQNNQFNNRIGLLDEMEESFHRTYTNGISPAHQTTYRRAVDLIQDEGAAAFDISGESAAVQQRYGNTNFGRGCMLARRLVEAGVAFVEVVLGGWDTHNRNFERVQANCEQVDPAMSALISDLDDRGLLDDTLVIWMGEFGRTPRINSRPPSPGRDHYPRAWSLAMFGCGLNGQVVGATDAEGAVVTERPVPTIDFMATVCSLLGIDYSRFNDSPIGRPIRVVDRGANPITELTGEPASNG